MKMNNKILFVLIIIGIVIDILGIVLLGYIYLSGGYIIQTEVKCYDRFRNEIMGTKCIEEEYVFYKEKLVNYFILAFIIGTLLAIMSSEKINNNNNIGKRSSRGDGERHGI